MTGRSRRGMALVPRILAATRARAGASGTPAAVPRRPMAPGLSVVMVAHDECDHLRECLAHLEGFADEVVVVDAESTDGSAELAEASADRLIRTTNKPMLEINKNVAMAAASRDWVLVLDPDERVSPTLRRQIREVVEGVGEGGPVGYWMPRRNYILGTWIRTMGMYPAAQLRLVRNGAGRFSEIEHHLPMSVDGAATGYLSGDLIHLSDRTVGEIVAKRTRYAEFAARQMHAAGVEFRISKLIREPTASFFKQYLLLGGFLDGVPGAIYAGLSAYGALLRQARLWELERTAARRARDADQSTR
jgi:glycosyltransferase involved in cell wall biosynthesis